MRNVFLFSVLSILSLLIVGCGNSNNDGQSNLDRRTYLRFFNAVPDASGLDLLIDESEYYTDVGYLESTGYFRLDTDPHHIIAKVVGSFAAPYDKDTTLTDEEDSSLYVYGPADNAKSLLLQDDNTQPGKDLSKVRVINLATTLGNLDVYITEGNNSFLSTAPVQDGLGVGAKSEYVTSQSGTYRITVTSRNSDAVLAVRTGQLFQSKGTYTVVIADTAPGRSPPKIVVLDDSKS